MLFDTSLFAFKHDCFSQEASTLGYRGEREIVLRSARTRAQVRYYLHHTEREPEGDVMAWRFLPVSDDARGNRAVMRTSVVIYND